MTADQEPLTYTVEEAAQLLRIGRGTCYEAVRSRQLPSIHIGRRILIPRCALERLLENGSVANLADKKMPPTEALGNGTVRGGSREAYPNV